MFIYKMGVDDHLGVSDAPLPPLLIRENKFKNDIAIFFYTSTGVVFM